MRGILLIVGICDAQVAKRSVQLQSALQRLFLSTDRLFRREAGYVVDTLHRQLTGTYLPEAAADPTLALEALVAAARGKRVLCVLDDAWQAQHARMLSCIDAHAGSRCVVTTRIRSLVPGAAEVQCDVLSQKRALTLLLREGGCEHLLESPPAAALEAVELCGRLPLALGIAAQ